MRTSSDLSDAETLVLLEKWRTGDRSAANLIIAGHPRLVRRAVKKGGGMRSFEDAAQEARLGVLRAITKFEAEKGRFWNYAYIWAVSFVRRWKVRDHLFRIGGVTAQTDDLIAVRKAEKELWKQGITPTATLVSEMTGIEHDVAYRYINGRDAGVLDLYTVIGGDNHMLLMELVPDERVVSAEERCPSLPGFDTKVENFMKLLSRRELQIFDERMWSYPERNTLKAIGEDWGVSREWIRQMQEKIVEYMRSYFRKELIELGCEHGASMKPWSPEEEQTEIVRQEES